MKYFKQKKLIWTALLICCLIFAAILFEDGSSPHKLPTQSVPGKLTVTSNGCCFWVENLAVSVADDGGQEYSVFKHDAVYEHDILTCGLPDSPSPAGLVVRFRCHYGDESEFSLPVLQFDDAGEMAQKGVLIYFQEHDDMYVNIVSGDIKVTYKMGDSTNPWALTEKPNRLYND